MDAVAAAVLPIDPVSLVLGIIGLVLTVAGIAAAAAWTVAAVIRTSNARVHARIDELSDNLVDKVHIIDGRLGVLETRVDEHVRQHDTGIHRRVRT